MAKQKVSREVMLDGAQMGLSVVLAGTMGFLKKHGLPTKDWAEYIGEAFEGALGTTPSEFLSGFGITRQDLASVYAMYEPAARAIGLQFTHELTDGRQKLSLKRASLHTNR